MKLVAVAIRDSAVDAFMRPFFVPTTAFAVRSLSQELKNAESPMAVSPQDYALFELGSFDEETGRFENLDSPKQVIRVQDLKEKSNAPAS